MSCAAADQPLNVTERVTNCVSGTSVPATWSRSVPIGWPVAVLPLVEYNPAVQDVVKEGEEVRTPKVILRRYPMAPALKVQYLAEVAPLGIAVEEALCVSNARRGQKSESTM